MCGGDGLHHQGRTVALTAAVSRRTFLAGTAAAASALFLGHRVTGPAAASAQNTTDLGGVAVIPRSAWAGDLVPAGPVPPEPDVRYLLVHHSVDPGNDYGEDDVAGILRGFFRFHTSKKGWPDLAYNFMVDRFGRVWEGRAGSLAGPVAGDATGGNQGFDQLCCFVGNHQVSPVSAAAFSAMGRLLGALASRYGVPVGAEATTVFVSRGSNRHPVGAEVATPTIVGHRDMSRTQCPGDLVVARLPELRRLASAAGPTALPPAAVVPSTTQTPAAPSEKPEPPPPLPVPVGTDPAAVADGSGGLGLWPVAAGGAAVAAAVGTGGVWARQRRISVTAGQGPDQKPASPGTPAP